jgi:hypothetical protein
MKTAFSPSASFPLNLPSSRSRSLATARRSLSETVFGVALPIQYTTPFSLQR